MGQFEDTFGDATVRGILVNHLLLRAGSSGARLRKEKEVT